MLERPESPGKNASLIDAYVDGYIAGEARAARDVPDVFTDAAQAEWLTGYDDALRVRNDGA